VCGRCARWNLSPLEERWEVIESCERLFRTATRRVSTDHIGLGVLPAGLELVRVGKPQRPEMAAWRYGGELLRRRRLRWVRGAVAGGALVIGGPLAGVLAMAGTRNYRTVVHTSSADGRPLRLQREDASEMFVVPEEDAWRLELRSFVRDRVIVAPEDAVRVAGHLLAFLNDRGAGRGDVEHAVRRIEVVGTGEDFFRAMAPKLQERVGALTRGEGRVAHAHPTLRLALEMAAHEESELQALRGELAALEDAWREAEEIGQIADSLLVPGPVRRALERLGLGPRTEGEASGGGEEG
jgi:hypothetical protein